MKIRLDEVGSVLLEFALVLPVFILLLLSTFNISMALQRAGIAADAARAGAQSALVKGFYTNTSQMQTVAITSAASSGISDFQATGSNFCTCSPGSGLMVPCGTFCANYGQAAMYAQVTVTGTLPMFFGNVAGIPIRFVARVRIPCPSC